MGRLAAKPRRTATGACLLALLSSTPSLLFAQADMGELRARLEQVRDTAELLRLEREHRGGGGAEDQLTAGFAALQLWELTGERRHADRSRRYFDAAADREPDNPWAHYGHALSFEPDIGRGPGVIAADDALGRALGLNAVSRARRALERAVAIEPALPGAAELLASYAARTWDRAALGLARSSLVEAASDSAAATSVLLALARAAREQGDFQAAVAAAERAAARRDAALGEAQLELARGLTNLADSAGAGDAYFGAVAAADEALLSRLWDDVAFLVHDADRARWVAARDTDERRAVLREFWQLRAALAGVSPGERVAEHYARLEYAWHYYRRHGEVGAPPLNAYRWQKIDPRFTDMGVLYIRHGEPEHTYASRGGDYLIWYYRDDQDDPLSYHFQRFGGQAGWSKDHILIRVLPCLEPEAALHDLRLRPLTYGCNPMRAQVVSATLRADFARALSTESGTPRFAREVAFQHDLYTFRGPDGRTDVVAGISVPADQIRVGSAPLAFSLNVVDTAHYAAMRVIGSAPVAPAGAPLELHLQLSAQPAAGVRYRITARDAQALSGGTSGGELELRDYSGAELTASDVVLASPDSGGSFERGGHRLRLAPARVFAGGRFRVFYELYNLPAGEPYRTEIRIERSGRGLLARLFGRGDALGLRFDEVAPEAGSTVPQLRDVTAPLEPGEYLLHLRVRTADATVERERRFTVPKR